MGQPHRQLSPPNLDLRHFQDHFGFTFPRVALTRFSGGFSCSVLELSATTRSFSSSAGNPAPAPTWVKNMGQAVFPHPGQKSCPTPRCRDCTIAFRNCKSFLPKRNCRQTVSIDPAQRQLTIRSDQIRGVNQLENFGGFTWFYAKALEPRFCREHHSKIMVDDTAWPNRRKQTQYY